MNGIKSAIAQASQVFTKPAPASASAPSTNGKPKTSKTATPHPLDALSSEEIALVSGTIRAHLLAESTALGAHKSTYVTLIEPPKSEVLAFLGIPLSPSDPIPSTEGITMPKRMAESAVIDSLTGKVYVFTVEIVSLAHSEAKVTHQEELAEGVQPGITMEELVEAEEVVKKDARVIKVCADVGITPDQIVCDCWSVGYEERFPNQRLQQAFVYARLGPHEHLYAHPLDFNCVVDSNTSKVLHIDFAHHRMNGGDKLSGSGSTAPHSLSVDSLTESGRERIAPPMERFDYLPELIAEDRIKKGEKPFEMRKDLKPLSVVQPEGVSFKLDGSRLTWQNWDLHIGFNYREGVVLNTVQYHDVDTDRLRPILYRASFAEMVVPYAAPEWPHPRKFAFDVGEYGLGMMCNTLELGCDCLGSIAYLDGVMSNHAGEAVVLKKCVCIHEEDDGLLWKHTDFRPGGKAHAVRSRKLVIQMVVTVANYEYLFAWNLRLDGTIELEIKLTGILNLYTMAEGEVGGVFGTEVAPRVMAHHHQHIFCLRLDPMIDGVKNSIVETDVLPLEGGTGSESNWAGNGFYSTKKILESTSTDGARMADPEKGRMWSFVNEDKKHYATGQPGGYKVMCKDFVKLMAKEDSLVGRRAPFATKHVWVTPFEQDQMFPAGKFVTQTLKAPEDSLQGWIKGDKPIRKTDIVTWFSFGVTHIPRPEDFPVMPYEHLTFTMKPVGFFKQNPALDVPTSTDKSSVAAFESEINGGSAALPMTAGTSCCSSSSPSTAATNGASTNGHGEGVNGGALTNGLAKAEL